MKDLFDSHWSIALSLIVKLKNASASVGSSLLISAAYAPIRACPPLLTQQCEASLPHVQSNIARLAALNEAQLEDIEPLLAFAKTLGGDEARSMTISVVARWAELDPPTAAKFAQSIRREERPQALILHHV